MTLTFMLVLVYSHRHIKTFLFKKSQVIHLIMLIHLKYAFFTMFLAVNCPNSSLVRIGLFRILQPVQMFLESSGY